MQTKLVLYNLLHFLVNIWHRTMQKLQTKQTNSRSTCIQLVNSVIEKH